jgi:hypothetical protein
MGLALEVIVDDDGTERFGTVWDERNDPEGLIFGDNMINAEKTKRVAALFEAKRANRESTLGYHIQSN